MKNYKKFFYIFAVMLFILFAFILTMNYFQMKKIKKEILFLQAHTFAKFISAFREVYQNNFIKYHINIDKKTIHLIPVTTIAEISKLFLTKTKENINIKLISDNPRNPKNLATPKESKILKTLQNKNGKKYYEQILNNSIIYYKPLYIEPVCLKCHSNKEKAPKYIKEHYNNSYGYKIGELKGAIVIQIKDSSFINLLKRNFKLRVFSAIFLYLAILFVVFFLLKKLEEKDKEYIKQLTITNQKLELEKQKAEQAAKIKSEFLANMSHEIRTPLNAMFGFIELLKEKSEDAEAQKYLNVIEKSGETLLGVINDILDLSKIESGKLNIEKISFNIQEEIEIIYNLFENSAKEKGVHLHIVEDIEFLYIISDPIRLKQIISNLLSNAIKFTENGKNVYLIIKCFDNTLYIEIKDEGIGISSDKLRHIFKAFSQADTSTTRKYGGTGLGLTISYKLVKLLGGELKVESQEGKGSKFYFSIPIQKANKQNIKHIDKNSNEKFNLHLLLVEDNKANQMFMSVILKKLGLTFDIAKDGIEAVQMYKQNHDKYSLILMDENMPNMSGSEATIKIREFERDNHISKHIFIVALTANALSGDKERFLEVGMDEYLTKPLDIEKLKEILRKLV